MSLELVGSGVIYSDPIGGTVVTNSTDIVVPEGAFWKVTSLHGIISCTAGAGNRIAQVLFRNGSGDFVKMVTWPTPIIASEGGWVDTAQGAAPYSYTGLAGNHWQVAPFDPILLPPGAYFHISDANGIAALDEFYLAAAYEEYRSVEAQLVRVQDVVSTRLIP